MRLRVCLLLLFMALSVGGAVDNQETISQIHDSSKSAKDRILEQFNEIEKGGAQAWRNLFQEINAQTAKRTNNLNFTFDSAIENMDKNRYSNIFPYDQNRILLGPERGYIDASPVPVAETGLEYILTQGPLDSTCGDFWQMIWEQNVHAIVMLNNPEEQGMSKCAPYFPSQSGKEMVFKPYKIVCGTVEDYGDFTVRFFSLHKDGVEGERRVVHLQHTAWPDYGVPKSIVELLKYERRYWKLFPEYAPTVVHCLAGVGRSGTFVVADTVIRMVDSGKDVDFADLIVGMREKRMELIQTPEQLRFCWKSVIDYLERYGRREEPSGRKQGDL